METTSCDILVIGSGPGGSTTASMLAEAGYDVVLVEEGRHLSIDSAPSYSLEEMDQKYRNGGLNTTIGSTNITYLEGRCAGGASEINAALYHRPRKSTLKDWQIRFQIADFDPDDLDEEFSSLETQMSVSTRPDVLGPSSLKLKSGADELGWKATEIPRFWKYGTDKDGHKTSVRQSMTQTLIPSAIKAGCRLFCDVRINKLLIRGKEAFAALGVKKAAAGQGQAVKFSFKRVIVCAGAVQTPLLLRRSGLTHNIGDSLRMHPMVRLAAQFDEPFNDPSFGVPVLQIEQFKPQLTLGCSHSSLPHLALWLEGKSGERHEQLKNWRHMGIFYVAAVGQGQGRIRNLPVLNEPFVRHGVPNEDLALLGEGLYRLGQVLFAAGATEIFNPISGQKSISHAKGLRDLRTNLTHGSANITTIHLFSSCPMGEDKRRCAVDSYGKVHDYSNLWIADASILPLSPAVNPQGTIMAVVRRNMKQFIATQVA